MQPRKSIWWRRWLYGCVNGGQLIGGIAGEGEIAKHYGRDVEELFMYLRLKQAIPTLADAS